MAETFDRSDDVPSSYLDLGGFDPYDFYDIPALRSSTAGFQPAAGGATIAEQDAGVVEQTAGGKPPNVICDEGFCRIVPEATPPKLGDDAAETNAGGQDEPVADGNEEKDAPGNHEQQEEPDAEAAGGSSTEENADESGGENADGDGEQPTGATGSQGDVTPDGGARPNPAGPDQPDAGAFDPYGFYDLPIPGFPTRPRPGTPTPERDQPPEPEQPVRPPQPLPGEETRPNEPVEPERPSEPARPGPTDRPAEPERPVETDRTQNPNRYGIESPAVTAYWLRQGARRAGDSVSPEPTTPGQLPPVPAPRIGPDGTVLPGTVTPPPVPDVSPRPGTNVPPPPVPDLTPRQEGQVPHPPAPDLVPRPLTGPRPVLPQPVDRLRPPDTVGPTHPTDSPQLPDVYGPGEFEEALRYAAQNDLPVFVRLGGPWCPACNTMDMQVWNSAQQDLRGRAVFVKIDPHAQDVRNSQSPLIRQVLQGVTAVPAVWSGTASLDASGRPLFSGRMHANAYDVVPQLDALRSRLQRR